MAKNEPNKPDDVKTTPENEAPAEKSNAPAATPPEIAGDTPAPEMTAEEAAILAHEGEAALKEMGEAEIEPPAPFDIDSKHIPDPGNVVMSFDKINEIVPEKQAVTPEAEKPPAPEKQETEKKAAPKKQTGRQDKAAPQKAQEAEKEDTRQEWEKPLSEVEAKKKQPRAEKQKPAVEKRPKKKSRKLPLLKRADKRERPKTRRFLTSRVVNLFQTPRKKVRKKRKTLRPTALLWKNVNRNLNRNCAINTVFPKQINLLSLGSLPKWNRLSDYRMKSCIPSKTILSMWRKTLNSWRLLPAYGRRA